MKLNGYAGLDTNIFKPHSTRSAATSAAKAAGVAGWRSTSVFGKFYNKPFLEVQSFATGVLNRALSM